MTKVIGYGATDLEIIICWRRNNGEDNSARTVFRLPSLTISEGWEVKVGKGPVMRCIIHQGNRVPGNRCVTIRKFQAQITIEIYVSGNIHVAGKVRTAHAEIHGGPS